MQQPLQRAAAAMRWELKARGILQRPIVCGASSSTGPSRVSDMHARAVNWWIWNAWVTSSAGNKLPVYALLAPTNGASGYCASEDVELPSGRRLSIMERVVSGEEAAPLITQLEQQADNVDLSGYWADAPPIPIKIYRSITAEAFGHNPAVIDCGYGMPSLPDVLGSRPDGAALIEACESALG